MHSFVFNCLIARETIALLRQYHFRFISVFLIERIIGSKRPKTNKGLLQSFASASKILKTCLFVLCVFVTLCAELN